jgi:hypothetical protein
MHAFIKHSGVLLTRADKAGAWTMQLEGWHPEACCLNGVPAFYCIVHCTPRCCCTHGCTLCDMWGSSGRHAYLFSVSHLRWPLFMWWCVMTSPFRQSDSARTCMAPSWMRSCQPGLFNIVMSQPQLTAVSTCWPNHELSNLLSRKPHVAELRDCWGTCVASYCACAYMHEPNARCLEAAHPLGACMQCRLVISAGII